MDIANLRVKVDSSQLRTADKDLNNFQKASKAAANAAKSFVAAYAGIAGVRSIVGLADSFTNLETKLKNVTKTTTEYNRTLAQLEQIAQRDGSSLSGLSDAFVKLNLSISDSLKESTDLVKVTELLSRGFAAAGTSAQTASGATLQLTQGLATDFKAAGQELNSIIEGAPLLAKTIAVQLGGNAATDLKKFAEEGRLTAKTFLEALLNSEAAIKSFNIPPTIERSIQRLRNSLLTIVGGSSSVQNASENIAKSIDILAANIESAATIIAAAGVAFVSRFIPSIIATISATIKLRSETVKNAIAFDRATAAMSNNIRMSLGLAKAQAAAAGSIGASTIVVNRAGQAAVASAANVGMFAASLRGLQAVGASVLSFFGGWAGLLISVVGGALIYFSTQTTNAEKAQERFADQLAKVRGEYGKTADALNRLNNETERQAIVRFKQEIREAEKIARGLRREIELDGIGGFFDQFSRFGTELSGQLRVLRQALQTGRISLDQYREGLFILADKFPEFAENAQDAAKKIDLYKASVMGANEAQSELNKLLAEQQNIPVPKSKPTTEDRRKKFGEDFFADVIEDAKTQQERFQEQIKKLQSALPLAQTEQETQAIIKRIAQLNEEIADLNKESVSASSALSTLTNSSEGLEVKTNNVSRSVEKSKNAFQLYKDLAEDTTRSLEQMAIRGLRSLEDSLVGIVQGTVSAKEAFRSMANQILEDLIRMQVQKSITGPIAGALDSFLPSLFGGGGTFGGVAPSASGFAAAQAANAGSGLNGPGFASGGSFTVGGVGGPDSQLVPLRLTPGEIVNVRKGGQQEQRAPNIIINNNASQAQVSAGVGGNGFDINVVIDDAFANNASRRGTKTFAALNNLGTPLSRG